MGRTKETKTLYRNIYGQIRCDGCGCYSDLIYPVHVHNRNGAWISMVCDHCKTWPPGCYVDQIDDPIDQKTYKGLIEDVNSPIDK